MFKTSLPGWPIALARIALGVFFLIAVSGKLHAGSAWPDHMARFLSMYDGKAVGFYWPFIQQVVIPHKATVGYMVIAGELFVGIALVCGICTRLASFIGLLMVANFMLLKGASFWVPTNHDSFYAILLLVCMFTGAGRSLGVDYFLAKRFGRSLLFW